MRRLYSRIYLHFIGVLLVVGVLSSLLFATGWRAEFVRVWTKRLAWHASKLVGGSFVEAPRRERMVRHLSEELDLDVTLRDVDGRPLHVFGRELPALPPEDLVEVRGGPQVLKRRGSWFVASPVRDPRTGVLLGYLQAAPMRRFAPADLARPVIMTVLLLGVIALAVRPLARRISRPVEKLTEATRRLGGGDLGYRIPPPKHHRHRRRRRHRDDELTELVRAWNEMAERIEKLVRGQRELLANVSHELRSPLARIQVALELLPDQGARVADVKQDLAELERLIDDVLTASRLDATGLPTHLERVDVAQLLAGLAERAAHDPLTAGKEVRVVAEGVGSLHADGALLRRALWNLVENAAKYGAPPITLAAERRADALVLRVTDEGTGIPPEERERVLEPFYRADRARTPDGRRSGVGLGLTLARRVVAVHGGTMRLDAAHPDRAAPGLTIVIELPLRDRTT